MRPFWALSPLELTRVSRRPEIRAAWRDVKAHTLGRDERGIRSWVFTLGWLAALQHHQALIRRLGEEQRAASEAIAARYSELSGMDKIL